MDQPYLFPLSDLKTKGYAQPESRWDTTDEGDTADEQQAEAA
ncbi:hypothetical protein [Streptomyces griseoluteus]